MVGHKQALRTALSFEDLLGRRPNDVEEKHAPPELYAQGPMPVPLELPRVSVIGTRRPTEEGIRSARAVSKVLVDNGIVVVSGLAAGTDAEAHRAAIALRGRTIAVLGTPLDLAYPARNAPLQKIIAENHLVLSQFAPGLPVARRNFVMRNRTMALISHATVIVEAGTSGGTQQQGWEAIRLGRPLFIMDSVEDKPGSEWPAKLLHYGAMKLSHMDDILEFVPPPGLGPPDMFTVAA